MSINFASFVSGNYFIDKNASELSMFMYNLLTYFVSFSWNL